MYAKGSEEKRASMCDEQWEDLRPIVRAAFITIAASDISGGHTITSAHMDVAYGGKFDGWVDMDALGTGYITADEWSNWCVCWLC